MKTIFFTLAFINVLSAQAFTTKCVYSSTKDGVIEAPMTLQTIKNKFGTTVNHFSVRLEKIDLVVATDPLIEKAFLYVADRATGKVLSGTWAGKDKDLQIDVNTSIEDQTYIIQCNLLPERAPVIGKEDPCYSKLVLNSVNFAALNLDLVADGALTSITQEHNLDNKSTYVVEVSDKHAKVRTVEIEMNPTNICKIKSIKSQE